MAQCPNDNFFWIQNNILSSIYTWNKIKLPRDLFPEWLYTVAKSSKLQKSCTEKNASYIHIEIFTDAQKVTGEKVIIRERTSISNNKFVLNYYVNCQTSSSDHPPF